MFDQQKFIARLQKIMNYYEINASTLADSLGVLRSSISHLLSERNKPSLDFVLKITEKYPEIDLYWLLYGKGSFPKEEPREEPKEKLPPKKVTPIAPPEIPFPPIEPPQEKPIEKNVPLKDIPKKEVQKIIFFYKDNSFEIFENL
ncbi:helix-turn-helix transcriptional regulator [Capnocytophaga gingivalis]|uniref:helix-turn-helix domain-containing protein n=1 Tax=Capnocytophaga gingivalis TaxID=1017 RepID=UPI000F171232|nr:helix-turn-helix transcriptional regulator [Capnocytophaga gingivalis]RKW15024.1 MAG: XRE family transcriptional regulator [Capnocytophaga sp.]